MSDDLRGRHLRAAHFPELLLRTDWDDPADRGLVSDFHHWQAPLLLTLSGLRPDTRKRLERVACRRPMELFRVRHLLPEVANPDMIKVPLVEAALRIAFS